VHPLSPGLRRSTAALLIACGAVACSDSLHLDPDPTISGSGGASSGVGGAGGNAPIACVSSADCPAPTAVCDEAKGLCVECGTVADCAFRPGTVCSLGECVCAAAAESWCPAIAEPPVSRGARCADLSSDGTDCGTCGHACFGACVESKCVDAWEPTPLAGAPSARARHACAAVGERLLVWGGQGAEGNLQSGGVLDLAGGTWKATSLANAPQPRGYVPGVAAGERFFVWGGHDGAPRGDGGLYDTATDTWKPVSAAGAPSARYLHTISWAAEAERVVVWGGYDGTDMLDTGALYDPVADTWTAMSTDAAPTRRREHVAAWNGSRLLVSGGLGFDGVTEGVPLADGALFDPASNTWEALPAAGHPTARYRHAAAAADGSFVVWGGATADDPPYAGDGAAFAAAWEPLAGSPPAARSGHTATWIGAPTEQVVFFGGVGVAGRLADGGIYDAKGSAFLPGPFPTGPVARELHCAAAVGTKLVVWGGQANAGATQTGGVLDVTP
jgi:hypothetical protein